MVVHLYSHGISRVPSYSGYCQSSLLFVYGAFTLFGQHFHVVLLRFDVPYAVRYPKGISTLGLASSAFARHYLRNLVWFLFLALLRCFSSGGFPHTAMYSLYDDIYCYIPDFSIRTSTDQCLLATPRSLSQLIASFFGSQCQGIHSALFVAWPLFFFFGSRLIL